jgi:hypothetical protein
MNYYYLIAGLPDLTPEDAHISMTPQQIEEELLAGVQPRDRALLSLYLHRHDNARLLALLNDPQSTPAEPETDGGLLSVETLRAAIEEVQSHGVEAECDIPDYMKRFLCRYLSNAPVVDDEDDERGTPIFRQSLLSELYYAEACACKQPCAAEWFGFERTLGNLLAAFNCRSLGLDPAPYMIGGGEVADALRHSKARDWGLATGDTAELYAAVAQAADEHDVLTKERTLDRLRWEHLDELICLKPFGIEQILAFLIRTDIIRRWQQLDPDAGEQRLRDIISTLKAGAIEL